MADLMSFLSQMERVYGKASWDRRPVVWLVALGIGFAVSIGAIIFRLSIGAFQWFAYGTSSESLYSFASQLPWYHLILAPTLGGIVVGFLLQYLMPGQRARGIADVIDARILADGKMNVRESIGSAGITAMSLGVGASSGREGPAAHLGAAIASYVAQKIGYGPVTARTLLGCGVAAAISASFNAPIAGILFALEVILGHYALRAFGPIVISSIAAAVISRIYFGEFPAFIVPDFELRTYWELPAFALLGVASAVVATIFMRSIIVSDGFVASIKTPVWTKPAVAGLMLGIISIWFPHILGVGYEAIDATLNEKLPFLLLVTLIGVKIAATSITIAGRFGGGFFSPSLYLGAMTGGAFGMVAAAIFPELSTSHGLYALVGMGAVSAAVLGAPISTTLIVFELTGEWEVSLVLLIAVSIATVLTQTWFGRSIFHWQLEQRGLEFEEGAHTYLPQKLKVSDIMTSHTVDVPVPEGTKTLSPSDSLGAAINMMEEYDLNELTVTTTIDDEKVIVGSLTYVVALKRFNEALIENQREEHR